MTETFWKLWYKLFGRKQIEQKALSKFAGSKAITQVPNNVLSVQRNIESQYKRKVAAELNVKQPTNTAKTAIVKPRIINDSPQYNYEPSMPRRYADDSNDFASNALIVSALNSYSTPAPSPEPERYSSGGGGDFGGGGASGSWDSDCSRSDSSSSYSSDSSSSSSDSSSSCSSTD